MQNLHTDLNIWSSSHVDHQDYGKLTKLEKKVFKELCSTRSRKFIDRVFEKKSQKELTFLAQLLTFYRLNTSRRRSAIFKKPCQHFKPMASKLLSTMIGLPADEICCHSGSPNWHARQGKRQSHTYRWNRLQESLDYLHMSMSQGKFNTPLVWSIISNMLPSGEKARFNHRQTEIKIIGKNKNEVEQIWETMIQIPLNLEASSSRGFVEMIGPLEYFDVSNSVEMGQAIGELEGCIAEASRKKEEYEKSLKVLQQNFAVINSTVVMANSTYEQ